MSGKQVFEAWITGTRMVDAGRPHGFDTRDTKHVIQEYLRERCGLPADYYFGGFSRAKAERLIRWADLHRKPRGLRARIANAVRR